MYLSKVPSRTTLGSEERTSTLIKQNIHLIKGSQTRNFRIYFLVYFLTKQFWVKGTFFMDWFLSPTISHRRHPRHNSVMKWRIIRHDYKNQLSLGKVKKNIIVLFNLSPFWLDLYVLFIDLPQQSDGKTKVCRGEEGGNTQWLGHST